MTRKELAEKLKRQGWPPVLVRAFEQVDRRDFVPAVFEESAYKDIALPIGYNQTISQPSTIAFMLDLLDPCPGKKILEVGSGSGYVLALLAVLAPQAEIWGAERIAALARRARKNFPAGNRIKIVNTPHGIGLPSKAPFDRILASAAAPGLPAPLVDQLASPGILVCPVENSIIKAEKTAAGLSVKEYPGFSFVKLHES